METIEPTSSGLNGTDLVLSEVHMDESGGDSECTVFITDSRTRGDSDAGDEPVRRGRMPRARLKFAHENLTTVDAVALQLWRGAFLLSEFIIAEQSRWHGRTVLELGAGVGLLTTVLARFAARVYCTDFLTHALAMASNNLAMNSAWVGAVDVARFKRLNWLHGWPPSESSDPENDWTPSELHDVENSADFFFGSDLVYDRVSVNALFLMLSSEGFMPTSKPERRLFFALEKRFNFELESLSMRPHGYSAFESHICQDTWHWLLQSEPEDGSVPSVHAPSCPSCDCGSTTDVPPNSPRFSARRIPVASFCPSVQHASYDRLCAAFELWEIKRSVPYVFSA